MSTSTADNRKKNINGDIAVITIAAAYFLHLCAWLYVASTPTVLIVCHILRVAASAVYNLKPMIH